MAYNKKKHTDFYPVRYVFSDTEKQQLGEALAASLQNHDNVSEELVAAKAAFNNRLKALTREKQELKQKVNEGFEIRDVECWVRIDQITGHKEFIDKLTGNLIGRKPLEREDRQYDLTDDEDVELPELIVDKTLEELRAAAAFFVIYYKPQAGALVAIVVTLGADAEGAPQEIVGLGRDRVGITYRSAVPFDSNALKALIDAGEAEVTMEWAEVLECLHLKEGRKGGKRGQSLTANRPGRAPGSLPGRAFSHN